MNASSLKVAATQWLYVLSGLRNGFPDALELPFKWKSSTGRDSRVGRSERVHYARIMSGGRGKEIVEQTLQQVTLIVKETERDLADSKLYNSVKHRISVPAESLFGLGPHDAHVLFFPPVAGQPHLWCSLTTARSTEKVQSTLEAVCEWFTPSFGDMFESKAFIRTLRTGSKAMFRARHLWNYPRTNRPTSDDKRLQFFAKALAGITLGISPATATKKLASWKPPRLWNPEMQEGDLQP